MTLPSDRTLPLAATPYDILKTCTSAAQARVALGRICPHLSGHVAHAALWLHQHHGTMETQTLAEQIFSAAHAHLFDTPNYEGDAVDDADEGDRSDSILARRTHLATYLCSLIIGVDPTMDGRSNDATQLFHDFLSVRRPYYTRSEDVLFATYVAMELALDRRAHHASPAMHSTMRNLHRGQSGKGNYRLVLQAINTGDALFARLDRADMPHAQWFVPSRLPRAGVMGIALHALELLPEPTGNLHTVVSFGGKRENWASLYNRMFDEERRRWIQNDTGDKEEDASLHEMDAIAASGNQRRIITAE